MTGLSGLLTGAATDLWLAVGLFVAAFGVLLLTRIGMLPKKSIPYVLLAVGGAFGWAWFRSRQARGLRQQLEKERRRLEGMEGRAAALRQQLGASEGRLDATRAAFEARRTAISESIVELDAAHQRRLRDVAGLSGETLDDEMTALLSRLEEHR